MKKVFLSMAILALLSTSCSKDNLSGVDDSVTLNSRGSDDSGHDDRGGDDRGGDDRGGSVGGGGGSKISAASVPGAVMTAYKKKYPSAMRAQWKKLDNGNYKVEFYVGNVKWQSIFSPAGTLLKQERH